MLWVAAWEESGFVFGPVFSFESVVSMLELLRGPTPAQGSLSCFRVLWVELRLALGSGFDEQLSSQLTCAWCPNLLVLHDGLFGLRPGSSEADWNDSSL